MMFHLKALYKRYIQGTPGIKTYLWISAFVFLLGTSLTFLSWYIEKQSVQDQKRVLLNEQYLNIESDISNRLNSYEQILRGFSGLYNSSEFVSRDQFSRYLEKYDLTKSYPGIASVGEIRLVQQDSLGAYLDSQQSQGFADFKVTPGGQRPVYAPITYVEPFEEYGAKVLGFDVYTDIYRSQVLSKVRDSGEIGITKKLTFLSDKGTSNDSSFVMYIPLYKPSASPKNVQERQANINGFIFAGSRAQNFFSRTINPTHLNAYSEVQVVDSTNIGDKSAVLYQSADFSKFGTNSRSKPFTVKAFDRVWTLQFAGSTKMYDRDTGLASRILAGGLVLSLAMAFLLLTLMLMRARSIVYSKQNEAQQAKDDLLSLASHQLRTPATAVKQYLGMILEGYTGAIKKHQQQPLQKAYSSNERQLETINQILYVAKADAGRLSINRNSFNINSLIRSVSDDISEIIEEKEQKLDTKLGRSKIMVFADEASMRMVIENLISNASKYSKTGAKIIVKSLHEGDVVSIAITDKGVGIKPSDIGKLFKKFSRIDNSLSLQSNGSGIGLYISKVLVELHGGRIKVESVEGKGSIFTIFLPMGDASNLTDVNKKDRSL